MNAAAQMRITLNGRGEGLRVRLRERLARVGELRCGEHGGPVVSVVINPCENGWFDAQWTTCCEPIGTVAATILGRRC